MVAIKNLLSGSYTLMGGETTTNGYEYKSTLKFNFLDDGRLQGSVFYESESESSCECLLVGKWNNNGSISYSLTYCGQLYNFKGLWANDIFAGIFWEVLEAYESWEDTPKNRKGELIHSISGSPSKKLADSIITRVKKLYIE